MHAGTVDEISGFAEVLLGIAKLDAKLNQLIAPPMPIIRLKQAMNMTGCNSVSAFQRFKKEFQIKTLNRGRYSRSDIENAIARRHHEKNLKAKPMTD